MKLIINSQEKSFETALTIMELLEQEGYKDMIVAVARNGEFIAKEKHPSTILEDADEIEIVAPMQGG